MCPKCNKELFYKDPGDFVKKFIGNLNKKCKKCGYETTVAKFKDHLKGCRLTVNCPDKSCND